MRKAQHQKPTNRKQQVISLAMAAAMAVNTAAPVLAAEGDGGDTSTVTISNDDNNTPTDTNNDNSNSPTDSNNGGGDDTGNSTDTPTPTQEYTAPESAPSPVPVSEQAVEDNAETREDNEGKIEANDSELGNYENLPTPAPSPTPDDGTTTEPTDPEPSEPTDPTEPGTGGSTDPGTDPTDPEMPVESETPSLEDLQAGVDEKAAELQKLEAGFQALEQQFANWDTLSESDKANLVSQYNTLASQYNNNAALDDDSYNSTLSQLVDGLKDKIGELNQEAVDNAAGAMGSVETTVGTASDEEKGTEATGNAEKLEDAGTTLTGNASTANTNSGYLPGEVTNEELKAVLEKLKETGEKIEATGGSALSSQITAAAANVNSAAAELAAAKTAYEQWVAGHDLANLTEDDVSEAKSLLDDYEICLGKYKSAADSFGLLAGVEGDDGYSESYNALVAGYNEAAINWNAQTGQNNATIVGAPKPAEGAGDASGNVATVEQNQSELDQGGKNAQKDIEQTIEDNAAEGQDSYEFTQDGKTYTVKQTTSDDGTVVSTVTVPDGDTNKQVVFTKQEDNTYTIQVGETTLTLNTVYKEVGNEPLTGLKDEEVTIDLAKPALPELPTVADMAKLSEEDLTQLVAKYNNAAENYKKASDAYNTLVGAPNEENEYDAGTINQLIQECNSVIDAYNAAYKLQVQNDNSGIIDENNKKLNGDENASTDAEKAGNTENVKDAIGTVDSESGKYQGGAVQTNHSTMVGNGNMSNAQGTVTINEDKSVTITTPTTATATTTYTVRIDDTGIPTITVTTPGDNGSGSTYKEYTIDSELAKGISFTEIYNQALEENDNNKEAALASAYQAYYEKIAGTVEADGYNDKAADFNNFTTAFENAMGLYNEIANQQNTDIKAKNDNITAAEDRNSVKQAISWNNNIKQENGTPVEDAIAAHKTYTVYKDDGTVESETEAITADTLDSLNSRVEGALTQLQSALSGTYDSDADKTAAVNAAITKYNAAANTYNSFVAATKSSSSTGTGADTPAQQANATKPIYQTNGSVYTQFFVRLDGEIPSETGDYSSQHASGKYMQDVGDKGQGDNSPLKVNVNLVTMESMGLIKGSTNENATVTVQGSYLAASEDGSTATISGTEEKFTIDDEGFLRTESGALYVDTDDWKNSGGTSQERSVAYRYQDGKFYVYIVEEENLYPAVGINGSYASAYVPGSTSLVKGNVIDQEKAKEYGITSVEGLENFFSNVYTQLKDENGNEINFDDAIATEAFYNALNKAHPDLISAFYREATSEDNNKFAVNGKEYVVKEESERDIQFLWYVLKSGNTGVLGGQQDVHVDGVMYWKSTLETVDQGGLRSVPVWESKLLNTVVTKLKKLAELDTGIKEYKQPLQTVAQLQILGAPDKLLAPLNYIQTLTPVDIETVTETLGKSTLIAAPTVEYLEMLDPLQYTPAGQPGSDLPGGDPTDEPSGGVDIPVIIPVVVPTTPVLTPAEEALQQEIVQAVQQTPTAADSTVVVDKSTGQTAAQTGDSTNVRGWLAGAAMAMLGLLGLGSYELVARKKRQDQ